MISIIIPVYNASDFVSHTITSILNNTIQPKQIIIVDDGSTDDSYRICKNFALSHEHITLIHQKNGGVSSARNCGLKYATSEYIWFVDADDWIMPDSIYVINEFLSKNERYYQPDILFSNMIVLGNPAIAQDKFIYHYNTEFLNENKNKDDLFYYLYETINIGWVIWRHIYRLEFIVQNQLVFDENLIMFEDMDWLMKVLIKAKRVSALNQTIYAYSNNNQNSLTRQKRTMRLYNDYATICIKWFRYFQNNMEEGKGRNALLKNISDSYKCAFTFIANLEKNDKTVAFKKYMNNFDIAIYNPFENFDKSILIK